MLNEYCNDQCQSTKDNGKTVASSVPAPASGSNPTADIPTAEFQALDVNGKVEATCDAKGYVFMPERTASIGPMVVFFFCFVCFLVVGCFMFHSTH